MEQCPHCLKEITEKDRRWLAAYNHAKKILGYYSEIPVQSGAFGFAMINKDIKKFEQGDRSDELLEELESTN